MSTPAPRPPRSLRRDLALGLSLGVAVLWVLAAVAAALAVRHAQDSVLDSALQETAERILPLAVIELINADTTDTVRRVAAIAPHDETLTYIVRNPAGTVLMTSHDADPGVFPHPPQEGFRDTATHRLFGRSAVSGTYILEIAEPLGARRAALIASFVALSLPMLALLPLSILWVLWFAGRSLRPVSALSHELAGRGPGDLAPLAVPALPEELAPIRLAADRLMADLSRALEAERSFSGNAAHELRTPVAAALAQTQRLIAELPHGPARERARTIEAELHRLARLAGNLLDLARAEGAQTRAAPPLDIVPIVELVSRDFWRTGRVKLDLPDHPVPVPIDPDALAILLRNLIENALMHGNDADPVTVTLDATGTLRVVNAGPVIAPERLLTLTQRFERAGSRAPGAGLGLAIAAAIARNAGLQLDLLSPAEGREDGFEARLRLPVE